MLRRTLEDARHPSGTQCVAVATESPSLAARRMIHDVLSTYTAIAVYQPAEVTYPPRKASTYQCNARSLSPTHSIETSNTMRIAFQ